MRHRLRILESVPKTVWQSIEKPMCVLERFNASVLPIDSVLQQTVSSRTLPFDRYMRALLQEARTARSMPILSNRQWVL